MVSSRRADWADASRETRSQTGIIGRAVLSTLLPARRPRYSARIVKCSTSRYHERDHSRPQGPTAITAIGITMSTPAARHRRSRPQPDQTLHPAAAAAADPAAAHHRHHHQPAPT